MGLLRYLLLLLCGMGAASVSIRINPPDGTFYDMLHSEIAHKLVEFEFTASDSPEAYLELHVTQSHHHLFLCPNPTTELSQCPNGPFSSVFRYSADFYPDMYHVAVKLLDTSHQSLAEAQARFFIGDYAEDADYSRLMMKHNNEFRSKGRSDTLRILLWNVPNLTMFQDWLLLNRGVRRPAPPGGYHLDFSMNPATLEDADCVIVYVEHLNKDSYYPPYKLPHQTWVLLRQENFQMFGKVDLPPTFLNNLDLYASFESRADIQMTVPSEYLLAVPAEDLFGLYSSTWMEVPFEQREKKAVMIYSNCHPPSKRMEYISELMKYFPIDSLGRCNNNMGEEADPRGFWFGRQDFVKKQQILKRYTFVIAFENSLVDDYISEKLFSGLQVGAIPIYRGAPNVNEYLPDPSAVVNVNDFEGPYQLAQYLLAVTQSKEMYEYHLAWKSRAVPDTFRDKMMKSSDTVYYRLHDLLVPKKAAKNRELSRTDL